VVGGGPAGLEFARVAAARGHGVVVLEAEEQAGGHVRLQSLLPSRGEYGLIGEWLANQAQKNGAEIRLSSPVTAETLDDVLAAEAPDHVVVATGSRYRGDGFQGWTAEPLPGHENGRCVPWTDVVTGRSAPAGSVVVLDDECSVVAPLTAVALADAGAAVTLLTRWPMVGLDTILDVYLDWILPKLYRSGVEMVADHFVRSIEDGSLDIYNVHDPERERSLPADWVVMVTARSSENSLHSLLKERGVSSELIGDAAAPRGTYEAVYEGHRQARKL
jgi:Pyridine nucleotide-disulphide oxidoreductase